MIVKRPMRTIRLMAKHLRQPQFERIVEELKENGQFERLSQRYREQLEFLKATYEIESTHRVKRKIMKHLAARHDDGDTEMEDEEMEESLSERRRINRRKREIWTVKEGNEP